MLDKSIHHTDQGNVCHYYIDIGGQCNELEDETKKGLTNMQPLTSLDEKQLGSCTITLATPMAPN